MITIRSYGRPEPCETPMQFAIYERGGHEPVAYVRDRKLARAIAGALADTLNAAPVVWDDGQT